MRTPRLRALVARIGGCCTAVALLIGAWLGCQPRSVDPATPAGAASGAQPTLAALSLSEVDASLWSAARESKAAFLRDLEQLVNIDSGTENADGLARIGRLLAQRLKELGAAVQEMPAPPSAGPMVRGTFSGSGTVRIMLMVHFDTVFPKGEAGKRPFKVVGNRAFGPGVADAKGGVTMILNALRLSRQRGFHDYRTLTVLFNSDEETGSDGSHEAIRTCAAQHDYVLSFEPPDQERVIVATNGVAYVRLRVAGRASHAGAAPEKGRNAAVELAGQILQLKDLGDPARGTTVNWTRIESGDRINVIPDKAEATADMRMSDMSEIDRVQRDASALVQKHIVPDTEVAVNVELRRPPFVRNAPSERLAATANQIYRELGKNVEPVAMRYGTDAGFAYQPGKAGPAVLEGLGIIGDRLHTVDEWADLDTVPPRLYLTVRMLEVLGQTKARPQ